MRRYHGTVAPEGAEAVLLAVLPVVPSHPLQLRKGQTERMCTILYGAVAVTLC